jgi:hypothetical protein
MLPQPVHSSCQSSFSRTSGSYSQYSSASSQLVPAIAAALSASISSRLAATLLSGGVVPRAALPDTVVSPGFLTTGSSACKRDSRQHIGPRVGDEGLRPVSSSTVSSAGVGVGDGGGGNRRGRGQQRGGGGGGGGGGAVAVVQSAAGTWSLVAISLKWAGNCP